MTSTVRQSLRYLVGAFIALGIDLTLVLAALLLGLPALASRLLGIVAGITTTYFFNRRFTFQPASSPSAAEWLKYVGAQSVGTGINFVGSSALMLLGDGSGWHAAAAVISGAAVGFVYNFFAARRVLHQR